MKKTFAAALIFLLVITGMTFPLVFKIHTSIAGFFSTDELFSVLWDCWRIKYSVAHGLSLTQTQLISAPFGQSFFSAGYISYLWIIWHHFLSMLAGAPLGLNLQVLINLFLSAFFTFLLVRFVSRSFAAGILGGIIFAFCPYQFMRMWQHLSLTYTEWLPLVMFAVIMVRYRQDKRGSLLFLVSLLCLCSFDFVTAFFGHIILVSYFFYTVLYVVRKKAFKDKVLLKAEYAYWKRAFAIWLLAMVLLSPQFYPVIKNIIKLSGTTQPSAFNPYRRSFEDLFSQSAHPLSYFLPSVVHPVFGNFTEQFIGSPLYGESFTEHTLYLGWVPLVLAGIAVARWKRIRKKSIVPSPQSIDENFYIGFFVFLAIVAWLFSQPPWWKWGPIKIYMPSFFMYKILPMFRAYCRFGIVVMLAVAVLAGFGLKFILERFKSNKAKAAITFLFCGLVLFEFWNWPPYKIIDVSKVPAVYYWLKEQPENFIIAEYPLDAKSPNDLFKYFQSTHQKRLINSTVPGTPANLLAKTITKLSEPRTAGVLKWMGVQFVLVHREDYLNGGIVEEIEDMNKISRNPGFRLVKTFPAQQCPHADIMCIEQTGPIDVYEVVAKPVEPVNKVK